MSIISVEDLRQSGQDYDRPGYFERDEAEMRASSAEADFPEGRLPITRHVPSFEADLSQIAFEDESRWRYQTIAREIVTVLSGADRTTNSSDSAEDSDESHSGASIIKTLVRLGGRGSLHEIADDSSFTVHEVYRIVGLLSTLQLISVSKAAPEAVDEIEIELSPPVERTREALIMISQPATERSKREQTVGRIAPVIGALGLAAGAVFASSIEGHAGALPPTLGLAAVFGYVGLLWTTHVWKRGRAR